MQPHSQFQPQNLSFFWAVQLNTETTKQPSKTDTSQWYIDSKNNSLCLSLIHPRFDLWRASNTMQLPAVGWESTYPTRNQKGTRQSWRLCLSSSQSFRWQLHDTAATALENSLHPAIPEVCCREMSRSCPRETSHGTPSQLLNTPSQELSYLGSHWP